MSCSGLFQRTVDATKKPSPTHIEGAQATRGAPAPSRRSLVISLGATVISPRAYHHPGAIVLVFLSLHAPHLGRFQRTVDTTKSLHLLREGTQATRGAPAPSRRCSGDITGISPPRCYTVFCLSSPPHFGTLPKDGGRNKKAVTSSEKKAHAARGGPAPSRRSRVISPGALVISPAYHRRWLRHSQVKAPAGGVGTFRPHPRAQ